MLPATQTTTKTTPSASATAMDGVIDSVTSASHPTSAPPATSSVAAFAANPESMLDDQEMPPVLTDTPSNVPDTNMPPSGSVSVPNLVEGNYAAPQKKQRKRARGASEAPKPSAKKRCTAAKDASGTVPLLSGTGSVSAPNNAPTWVVNAVELFNTANLGPEWKSLVTSWLKFEQNSQYLAHGRLGTHRRPQVVGDWIQRARPDDYQPDIGKPAAFAKEFSAWWQSLQPDWRTVSADRSLPQIRENWEEIRRPGINGLLSVVAALFFWGFAIRNKGSTMRSPWLNALNDVVYVLDQLA